MTYSFRNPELRCDRQVVRRKKIPLVVIPHEMIECLGPELMLNFLDALDVDNLGALLRDESVERFLSSSLTLQLSCSAPRLAAFGAKLLLKSI